MRIFLTGGTGFLGRYLISRFLSDGHRVVALSRNANGQKPDRGLEWVDGELGGGGQTVKAIGDADAVVHAGHFRGPAEEGSGGGRVSFIGQEGDAEDYFRVNVLGTIQLMDAAVDAGCRRFIAISSGAVHGRVVDDRPLDERHPHWPTSLYGAAKASIESLGHAYGFSGRLEMATLRPTAIYGVDDPIEQSRWYALVRELAAGHDVNVSGGAKTVHVADVAAAVALLLTTDQPIAGETYNCCERMISDHEVATIAKRLSGSNVVIKGHPKRAKHEMRSDKLRSLGFEFGGLPRLKQTIERLLDG